MVSIQGVQLARVSSRRKLCAQTKKKCVEMNKKKCVEEVNTAIGDLMTHKKKSERK